jgi:NADH-quinone oxidoreductase subunit L
MVAAIGCQAPGSAMFHLFTHAFFKALLFLGAGAVIHGLHHEQDIWKMGGLRKTMPKTFLTFTIGTLALTGAPFLAGFFSKDAILLAAYHKGALFFFPLLLSAVLTAFYMTRLVVVAFCGEAYHPIEHSDPKDHGHDAPPAMMVPLFILAALSVIAGYGFFAESIFGHDLFHTVHALATSAASGALEYAETPHVSLVPTLAVGAFVVGTLGAWVLYSGKAKDPVRIPMFANRFYIDEVYAALIAGSQEMLAAVSDWIDRYIIDGALVRGIAGLTWGSGYVLRLLQLGNIQGYAFIFGAGVVVLLFLLNK